jgi:superfamily II DNA or RNA helicase
VVQAVEQATDTLVVHANWSAGRLHVWAESTARFGAPPALDAAQPEQPQPDQPQPESESGPAGVGQAQLAQFEVAAIAHPFATLPHELFAGVDGVVEDRIDIRLPACNDRPLPSATLSLTLGRGPEAPGDVSLGVFSTPTLSIEPEHVAQIVERLYESDSLSMGAGVRYFAAAARLARHLLARQRFVPMMRQDGAGKLTGSWHPWLADERTAGLVGELVGAMPAAARAARDEFENDAWLITEDFIARSIDAACRAVLILEEMTDTVEGQDPVADPQVAWLNGLLGEEELVPSPLPQRNEIVRRVRRWIGGLEDRGQSSDWRLGFRLNEPVSDKIPDDMTKAGDDVHWSISFFLQSQDAPDVVVEAADVWLLTRESAVIEGLKLEAPQDLLLAELGRASRLYKKLEECLDENEPFEISMNTEQAYEFLRESKPVLVEQGFAVEAPGWWDSPSGRLGARLRIDSDPLDELLDESGGQSAASSPAIGLSALVGYHWEIAIGDTTLTLNEFEKFASQASPLVRIGGNWVEIRPEDVQHAIKFIRENPGGEMPLVEAMRLAYGSDIRQTGIPIVGLEATGWVSELFGGMDTAAIQLPQLETPDTFKGTLRPYQSRGLSWLSFMERFGFGACLADDMGLGKTIQMLALLAHERKEAEGNRAAGETDPRLTVVLPTLLVVPMSVVGNWMKETERFTPSIKVVVHHGIDRAQGDEFVEAVGNADLIITTYALANRDQELIERVTWGRIVLDEAQFVKNPAAKQSQAVRAFNVERRVALTGTPVENRLSELWSIMDFLNPGYLGTAGNFRKRFAVPIERYHDQSRSAQLRGLVRPFILRRVKTDPTVVADLPEKLESKEYCHLTSEQAQLYESCVKRMLADVDQSEGIHRRGLVLAALIKLKQVCNHPSQMLKDHDPKSVVPVDPGRSGKCVRLLEMLDEVISEGDSSLIFTQFRQMGHIMSSFLRHELGKEILFLHGGTPQAQRQKLIDRFQESTGKTPILILSLKAGGVGLNLTAATHVFHFDRWWNPAVENQATDRAYRIGQTRTVQVHKFVVRGTLEERIDEMIESKMELAENIIGHGERWLTELDSNQLREMLTLRTDAIGDEDD